MKVEDKATCVCCLSGRYGCEVQVVEHSNGASTNLTAAQSLLPPAPHRLACLLSTSTMRASTERFMAHKKTKLIRSQRGEKERRNRSTFSPLALHSSPSRRHCRLRIESKISIISSFSSSGPDCPNIFIIAHRLRVQLFE